MYKIKSTIGTLLALSMFSGFAFAHGDVSPQAVNSSSLPDIGEEWLESNPYRGNKKAIEVGASAYNQNCARCHGLGGKSGGIAPDLRELEVGDSGDEWYIYRVRKGAVVNGRVYMPPFEGIFDQKAMWAIRAWLETVEPG
jgi:cytochrome c-550 PedF